jgi:hypothetical protein
VVASSFHILMRRRLTGQKNTIGSTVFRGHSEGP